MDGQLSDDHGSSKWISSSRELDFTHELRGHYSAIMVGAGTYLNDLAQLTVRRVPHPPEQQPIRIILDPRGRVSQTIARNTTDSLKYTLDLKNSLRPTVLIGQASEELKKLKNLLVIESDIDLSQKDHLYSKLQNAFAKVEISLQTSIDHILVEGGGSLITQLMKSQCYRKVIISIAPKFTGGHKNRIFLEKPLNQAKYLEVENVHMKGTDVVFELLNTEIEVSP